LSHPLPRDLITPEVAAADLDTALRVGFEAIRRDPAAARFAIGRVQLATGRPRAAERSFWAALVAQPQAIGLRAWIATARLQRGDAAGALDALREDGELPDDAFAAAARVRALAALGRVEEARAAIAHALTLVPDDPGLLLLDARLAYDAGDVQSAFERCDAVAAAHPALPDPRLMQAEMLAMQGDVQAADRLLADHLGLAAVDPRVAFLLAELRLRAGTGPDAPGEALFSLLPLLAELASGRADLLCELSSLMGELGDAAGAQLLLRDAVAADPDAAEPRFRLALLAEALGEPAEALAAYREVLRRDPDHAGAAERIAAFEAG
jgi:tetratricopeptide (TPR) repeat protein